MLQLTLPQEPQVLESPLVSAPHLGQLVWKLTMTVVDCMLIALMAFVSFNLMEGFCLQSCGS